MFLVKSLKEGCIRPVYYLTKQMKLTGGFWSKEHIAIALNILYIKEKETLQAYISKYNATHEKQINLLMISNECHYLEIKKLSTLLRVIISKHRGDFHCLSCLHSFRKETKHKSHESVCKNKVFCEIVLPSETGNILEFNQYTSSDKMPYINRPEKILEYTKKKKTMMQWFVYNSGVPCSKPLDGSKGDSAFHPSEVDEKSTRTF